MRKLFLIIAILACVPLLISATSFEAKKKVTARKSVAAGCVKNATEYLKCETTWSDLNLDSANAVCQELNGDGSTLHSLQMFLNDEGTDGTLTVRLCDTNNCTGGSILEQWTSPTVTGGGAAWYEMVSVGNPVLTNATKLHLCALEDGAFDTSWEMMNDETCDGDGTTHVVYATGGGGDWEMDDEHATRDFNYRIYECQ